MVVVDVILDTSEDNWGGWRKNTEKLEGWRKLSEPGTGQSIFGSCPEEKSEAHWLLSDNFVMHEALFINIEMWFKVKACVNGTNTCSSRPFQLFLSSTGFTSTSSSSAMQEKELTNSTQLTLAGRSAASEPGLQKWSFTLQTRDANFKMAIKNEDSCVMIHRILMYHYFCPASSINYLELPRTASGSPLQSPLEIRGKCVNGAVPVITAGRPLRHIVLSYYCLPDGQWKPLGSFSRGCTCNSGFESDLFNSSCRGKHNLPINIALD
ncbi:hypothetical protein Ciccas_001656 [Cichlidogyrus casuarinus]|uniref:Eph LBD domain-containing protein n=1 Tax=Cichlidogyrus casuarinus TaxID=1844966 RepID=A0ABD2QJE0_9PLAT